MSVSNWWDWYKQRIHGVADVVEITGKPPRPYPVEYKRGRPKAHRADEVQLCAQALCLEEMFNCPVPEGALFYGQSRRRKTVSIDDDLRRLTLDTLDQARTTFAGGRLPEPDYAPRRCESCSLIVLCRPKSRCLVTDWFDKALASNQVPE